MKISNNKVILFALVLSGIFFSKCSLLEHDIDGELTTTLNVSESKSATDVLYQNTTVLDADSDEDIQDNLDKIKDWAVTEVSYSIMGYTGDESGTFSGSIGFSKKSDTSASISVSIANLNLNDVSDDGKKYKLSLSESQLATIAGYLKDDQAVKIYFDGTLSTAPMSFDLKIYESVRVTGKLL